MKTIHNPSGSKPILFVLSLMEAQAPGCRGPNELRYAMLLIACEVVAAERLATPGVQS